MRRPASRRPFCIRMRLAPLRLRKEARDSTIDAESDEETREHVGRVMGEHEHATREDRGEARPEERPASRRGQPRNETADGADVQRVT